MQQLVDNMWLAAPDSSTTCTTVMVVLCKCDNNNKDMKLCLMCNAGWQVNISKSLKPHKLILALSA